MHDWGSLEVSLVPPVPMHLVFLPFVPHEQLHRKLGLEVLVNGEPVEGMRLGKVKSEVVSKRKKAGEARRFGSIRKRWLYQDVKPANLLQYVGRKVKLQERGDLIRVGLLADVVDGEALVQQRLSGGKFVAHVPLKDVVKAEVFSLKVVE